MTGQNLNIALPKASNPVEDDSEEQPNRILLIGAGQLGSRFLQGIAILPATFTFHVVDVSEDAIKTTTGRYNEALQLFEEKRKRVPRHTLTAFKDVDELPKNIEYQLAVVTTTADVRRQVLEKLLQSNIRVTNLILEKVLFQKLQDYDAVTNLLKSKLLFEKTSVHHPRRYWSFYIALKRRLAKLPGCIDLKVSGSNWGMACNSVHFIDLHYMLNEGKGVEPHEQDIIEFEAFKEFAPPVSSKRSGFKEISGVLKGRWSDDSSIEISCEVEDKKEMELRVEISHPEINIVVDEVKGTAVIKEPEEEEQEELAEFDIPLVSRLSGVYVQDILVDAMMSFSPRNQCRLPSYELSCEIHKAFLKPLVRYFEPNPTDESSVAAPIT